MEKLASIRAFTKVVQHNSFAAAARDLRLSRSAVSKHVIELEEERGRVEQKNGVTNARQKWRDAPLTKKAPYEPDAGNRHVRFDERGWETERCRMAPSYRAHPRLYLGVFHCGAQNFDAIGGTADIGWPPTPIASEAYDPGCVKTPKTRKRGE
jgi:hypothetical protein